MPIEIDSFRSNAKSLEIFIPKHYDFLFDKYWIIQKNIIPKLLFLIFRYSWQKNGKPYDWQVYDDRILQQPGRGTLVITSPRDEDIGM